MAGEPEEVNRFQREMSLNWTGGRGSDARVNERNRAERRTTDVGPDRGVCGGESEDWFSAPKGEARYEFIERILKSQQYRRLSCGQKGTVRRSSSPNGEQHGSWQLGTAPEQQWEVRPDHGWHEGRKPEPVV